MLQPNPTESDPLLAFCEEQQPTQPVEPAEPAEAAQPVERVELSEPAAFGELRGRLDRAERQIERALIEFTSLKSDLATLVGAVDDIRKRTSRAPDAPDAGAGRGATVVALPRRPKPGPTAITAIVLLLIAGAALWGLVAVATFEVPAPAPIDSESLLIIAAPPVVSAQPPSLPRADPPRAVTYVGTLTVDADPGGDVFLNRQNVGSTPVRLENLRAGSHLIWIERDGYRRWTRVVPVAANRISRVSASLDRIAR